MARLRDWAVRPVRAGCYSWAALPLIDSKTLYIKLDADDVLSSRYLFSTEPLSEFKLCSEDTL